jgi:hypothetical protein
MGNGNNGNEMDYSDTDVVRRLSLVVGRLSSLFPFVVVYGQKER